MCGIVGITGRQPELIEEMSGRLSHRGPDDSGVFVDDWISLAHRRLAVLDVSERAHQPMAFRDWVISYNGEIYNFREIRRELEGAGHTFVSGSDTEVLLHGFEEWGEGTLDRLNGMFAFALYNRVRRELLLVRDRLGIKPLYYRRDGEQWMFASEIKALRPAMQSAELDADALVDYLTYRFVPDERTVFRGVQRVKPGHLLKIDLATGACEHRAYWRLAYSENGRSVEENAERVRELLKASVRRRLVSDVPLGVYLSGGVDSSALLAMMARESDVPVKAYTVVLDDASGSDVRFARLAASRYGAEHHEIPVACDAVSVLPDVVRHLDEPIGDAAAIPTYLMARETKKHVTVILSGEGSDELFAGYEKYRPLARSGRLPGIPRVFRSGLPGRANALFDRDAVRKYRRFAAVFDDAGLKRLLSFRPVDERRFDPAPYFGTGNTLNDLLSLDMGTWLPNDLFLKGDKMTMAHAVEARVPFMDHELVEFASTIPARQKLTWRGDKLVYRRAVAPLLPPEIVRRKKQGFTPPLSRWLDAGLRDYALEMVRSADMPELDGREAESTVLRPCRTIFDRRRFWTVLFLVAWYCHVFKGNGQDR